MRPARNRRLSLIAAVALAIAAFAPMHGVVAQAKPLKLGVLLPLSGPFEALGNYTREGLELYLKEHNDQLGGRRVDIVYGDDTNNPAVGLTQLRRMVEQDHVDLLFGPVAANVGAAAVPFVNQHKIAMIWPIVCDDDLTRHPSDYIVRTGWVCSQTTHVLGDYAYKTLGYRKAATIGYDFNFGWQSIQGFADVFMRDGGKITKEIWTPIVTTDFSSYLSALPRDVDVIMCSFSGSPAINFFKQYREFGVKIPLICQGNATDESTLDAEGPAAAGIVTALQYTPEIDSSANRTFVDAYKKAFGHLPGYYGEGGYVGAQFLDKGLAMLHGDTSDPAALIKAIRGLSLPNAPRGPITLDAYGAPIQNVYIRKVEDKGGKLQNTVLKTYPKVSEFWTWTPQEYLARPAYNRSTPPCNACGG
jgi:branched-chain amino acid transport system substrate-binding protein